MNIIRSTKNFFIKCIKVAFFNYEKPRYSTFIYHLAREYVNYYRGNSNSNMDTNGEERFLRSIIKDGMVIFDVGANIGEYSSRIYNINTNIIIHCFEPDQEIFEKINIPGIYKNNIALSDKIGTVKFYKNYDHSVLNSFYDMRSEIFNVYDSVKPTEVKTTTIDEYCKSNSVNHIDLLKIDVEGHEMNVLNGCKNMLKEVAIDKIEFEFGYGSMYARVFLKDFFDFFEKYGYEIYKIKALGIEKVIYSPEEECCPYANFVAIKK